MQNIGYSKTRVMRTKFDGSTCVPHLSFCFEETSIDASCQILTHLSTRF